MYRKLCRVYFPIVVGEPPRWRVHSLVSNYSSTLSPKFSRSITTIINKPANVMSTFYSLPQCLIGSTASNAQYLSHNATSGMTISVLSTDGTSAREGGVLNFDDEYNDIESKRSPLLQGDSFLKPMCATSPLLDIPHPLKIVILFLSPLINIMTNQR